MDSKTNGWLNGFIGMLIFSGSLPATRVAVMDFDPMFLTAARAGIAGVIALVVLVAFRVQRPSRTDANSFLIAAIGVVIGFPLLTALALQHVTAAHSIIYIALLPLVTALFGVLRGGERPRLAFWFFSALGSALVIGFVLHDGIESASIGDLYMFAAIIVCGMGYAEGAILSRKHGGWQVICWALVFSLPLMLILAYALKPDTYSNIGQPAWLGLAYVSLFSMFIGFIFWYRGLAQGGIGAVGQLQLLQPFFGLLLAALILNESVSLAMIGTSILVVLCVFAAKRTAG